MNSNNELRQNLKSKRSALSEEQQIKASTAACERFLSFIDIKTIKHFAAYFPCKGEISPLPLLELSNQNNNFCYLPTLSTQDENHLYFNRWLPSIEMQKNIFGIPEPLFDKATSCMPNQLDVVIVPLLGFDKNCNRLGMGGGYYDRSFAFKKNNPTKQQTLLIGFAHDIQLCGSINVEAWDVQLDAIVTPSKIYEPKIL